MLWLHVSTASQPLRCQPCFAALLTEHERNPTTFLLQTQNQEHQGKCTTAFRLRPEAGAVPGQDLEVRARAAPSLRANHCPLRLLLGSRLWLRAPHWKHSLDGLQRLEAGNASPVGLFRKQRLRASKTQPMKRHWSEQIRPGEGRKPVPKRAGRDTKTWAHRLASTCTGTLAR